MNTRTTIILLIVVLALGGGVLMMLSQDEKAAQKPTAALATAQDLFSPKPQIVKLQIERPDGSPQAIELRKDQWFLTKPVTALAQQPPIKDELKKICDLQYVQKYEPGAVDTPGDDVTGLKSPNIVLTIQGADGASHTLKIGKLRPLGRATYVAMDSDPAVYVVKKNLLQDLATPLTDYRDRFVNNVKYADNTRIRVQGLHNYEVVRLNKKWYVEKPVHARVDMSRFYDVLRTVTRVYAEDFVTDTPANLRIYGLDKPRMTITMSTQTVPASASASQPAASQPVIHSVTLLIGAKAGDKYFAKLADDPTVFQISEENYKNMDASLMDVREKTLAAIDSDKIEMLEVDTPGKTARLTPNGRDQWVMTGTYKGKAELLAVNDLIKAITHTFAAGFEDEPNPLTPYGFDKPRARIEIVQQGQTTPAELIVGADTPSGEMTYIKTTADNTIAVVKKTDAEALMADPGTLVDRSVTTFAGNDIRKMEITRNGHKSVLARGDDNTWRLTEPVKCRRTMTPPRRSWRTCRTCRLARWLPAAMARHMAWRSRRPA